MMLVSRCPEYDPCETQLGPTLVHSLQRGIPGVTLSHRCVEKCTIQRGVSHNDHTPEEMTR
jgi:hypothetical protein